MIKRVYYRSDDINEWVGKLKGPNRVGAGNSVFSVQEVELYKTKNFDKTAGKVLQNVTSYTNPSILESGELITYNSTYFFKKGSISFDINLQNQTTDRKLNPGTYVFNISGGTGKYLNIKGHVIFVATESTRKVTFYEDK